ncbi:PREDICTED: F-box/FBD/LRR-repeat protein At5g18770-like [Camelina sativa]|uniref:F-box/FBD/LRR-repeat protein At5g18770-like n=1 Tax=Camelina sativa TaxID=90675 RepID=A0ABM0WAR4_CAMSA|nr:PREDICTED: F-box/FBD/LRR-repeat protein At5g18770-like [Camelina sativa]
MDNDLMSLSGLKTSIRTWRNPWKWVPVLDVDSFDFPNHEACVDFINKFLSFQSEFYLREFKLVTECVSIYEPCLVRVLKRKIQHFQVDNQFALQSMKIPLNQSVCENLVCLKLYSTRLTEFESLSLPCLKIMYLKDVKLPRNVVVEIDTPRLKYLTLIDYNFKRFFKIISMSDSVKVDIDIDVDRRDIAGYILSEINVIYNLLSNFTAVKVMTISRKTLQELVKDDLRRETKLSTVLSFCLVSSLESVEMESPITEKETEKKLVRYFLDNATSLKKLVLRLNLSQGEKHKWRNPWKWVPVLDVDSFDFPNHEACVDFINKFLSFQSEFYLREFKLVTECVSIYEPCLVRVLKRKIQHFQVDNQFALQSMKIPLNQSVCENLVCLKLYFTRLTEFESLSLPCLKIMYLKGVKLPRNVVVEIDTPRLEYLTLIDYNFKRFFKIISMSDSVKVDIDVDRRDLVDYILSEINLIYKLLSNFTAVKGMTISRKTLQLIYFFRNDINPLPKFRDLIRLRASMFLDTSMVLLPIVLESCPNLKHLTLVMTCFSLHFTSSYLTKLSTVLSFCLVSSLESVEMESPITEKETEKKLVRYFLDNATSLKKLVLRLNLSCGEKQEPDDHLKSLFDSPRRSSLCKFEVTVVQTAKV